MSATPTASVLHAQAVAVLYGVRAMRAQTSAEREAPRGVALAELVERGAELLVVLLDHEATDPATDADPARCGEHNCEHPEDQRSGRMGGALPLCTKCGCEVKEA